MKIIFFTFLLAVVSVNTFGQLLGVYEFTGIGSCPNQNPNVTTQPINSEFEDFSMQNVYCVSTANVFNTKSWNTTTTVNLSEFIQFGAHTISCFRMNLDSIVFDFRNTASGNTPTWHLRSSLDNYTSNIASGVSATNTGMFSSSIVLNNAVFSTLAEVKFRFYLTEMGSVGAAFRIDNLKIYGSESFVGTVDYFVDNDGDGFGSGPATSACINPGGFSLNNLDCDDNNASINPNTFWYDDADGDGFGSDAAYETGCTSTYANPVTTGDDCDDNSNLINPNTIWYQDIDSDGFGDDNNSEVGCSSTLTNPVIVNGDCDDNNPTIHPNTIWYADNDGDGFGDPNTTETACNSSFFVPVLNGDDCDDSRDYIYPNASEICDGFDNDCNGITDDGLSLITYYIDNDGDGFGAGSAGDFCSDPGIGYCLNNDDCNDDDASINPSGLDEPGNGIDEDCNGSDEPFFGIDNDFDGYDEGTDCDDGNPDVNPGATEIPNNGIDEDCDGSDLINGITENSKTALKIFPNPGTNSMFILTSNFEKENFTIQVIDNQGKVILEDHLDLNQLGTMEINTSEFAKGAYQIVIQNDKQIFRNSWMKI